MDEPKVIALANAIAEQDGRDVFFYSGPIGRPLDDHVIELCRGRKNRRKELLLILVTEGGDGDAAFRIATCFQHHYEKVVCFVTGFCKSAGTLVALGAHELAFTEHGELGPLDIQMRKADDWESTSGLTVISSLQAMQTQSQLMFERIVRDLRRMELFSAKKASEIATELTVGLLAPIFSQIEAMHIGESSRGQEIGRYYGRRLNRVSENLREGALARLLADYPDHGYVINAEEAGDLFVDVRPASEPEAALADEMGPSAIMPISAWGTESPDIRFLSDEEVTTDDANSPNQANNESGTDGGENPPDSGPATGGNGAALATTG